MSKQKVILHIEAELEKAELQNLNQAQLETIDQQLGAITNGSWRHNQMAMRATASNSDARDVPKKKELFQDLDRTVLGKSCHD